jgi:hypothetical protein
MILKYAENELDALLTVKRRISLLLRRLKARPSAVVVTSNLKSQFGYQNSAMCLSKCAAAASTVNVACQPQSDPSVNNGSHVGRTMEATTVTADVGTKRSRFIEESDASEESRRRKRMRLIL